MNYKKKRTFLKIITSHDYKKLSCTTSPVLLLCIVDLSLGSNHRCVVTELHKTPDVLRGPGDLSYPLSPSNFIISGNRNIFFYYKAPMLTHVFHSLKKWQPLRICMISKTAGIQTSINARERLFTDHMGGIRITDIPFHCQTVIRGIQ